ncbi:hypothetical protein ACFOSW_16295 [Paenibacillus sp. GCM10012303]
MINSGSQTSISARRIEQTVPRRAAPLTGPPRRRLPPLLPFAVLRLHVGRLAGLADEPSVLRQYGDDNLNRGFFILLAASAYRNAEAEIVQR